MENVTFDAPTLSALKKAGITAFFTVYARYSDSECPGTRVEAIGDFQSSEEANDYVAELDSKYGKGSKKKLGNVRVAP